MDTRTAMHAAKIFENAASYIRQYGWQVTGMSRHGMPRCSMGALASAHPSSTWDTALARLMYEKLYEELGGIGLTDFNYRHNNGEAVARLFENVATKLRIQSASYQLSFTQQYRTMKEVEHSIS